MPTAERSSTLRPPLKWAGGKRWQVPYLQPIWKSHSSRRLVEPFCGGLAVALGLGPRHALLNDANPHLINFYRWLQRGLVVDLLMENNEALFYRHRDRFNGLLATGEGASREAEAHAKDDMAFWLAARGSDRSRFGGRPANGAPVLLVVTKRRCFRVSDSTDFGYRFAACSVGI